MSNEMKEIKVSLLTSTYNRGNKIGRLYASLQKQTRKDIFEWVIMNDGSTDNTEEVISGFMDEAPFPIRYFKQENSGKHIALNRLFEEAAGEYSLTIDDDDELLPDAIERFLKLWDQYGDNDSLWCIGGRCIDPSNGMIVGKPLPKGINNLPWKERRIASKKAGGERCGMARTAYLRRYKFPEVKLRYMPEIYVWSRLDAVYEQYYFDEPFRIYHRLEGEAITNHEKTMEWCESNFIMHRYEFGDSYMRPKRFSHVYNRNIYNYRLEKVKTGKSNKEFYLPYKITEADGKEVYLSLDLVDKIVLWLTRFPCFILRLMKGEN